ncbi:MAG: group II intron reverse transcriptase/maturase [Firmicutes bacterium]|nr:group II intron reverse transcriptase/maturase [Bacillota bacterium]
MPVKGQQHPIEKSRELQRKLYLAAKANKERRFHALYDRIFRPDILWRAWMEVQQNGGSAGVDGVTIEDIEQQGVSQLLAEVGEELRNGNYHPQPVLRVYIPKPDGRKRPLGIPTVKDRIVQQACRIVIEPIFEANFQDCSYGFRPKRGAQEAVLAVNKELMGGWYVVDADIQSYFDNIDHEILMSLLKRRISDHRVLKLLQRWLKAGVVEDGKKLPTDKGSPQGGVISPLLANIYLHVLDTYWTREYEHLGKLYRYADDFVVICKKYQEATQALQIIQKILGRLKLTLHPLKTKIVHMKDKGFDFLGFHFHKLKAKSNGKLYPYLWPTQKALKAIRETIREKTKRRSSYQKLAEIVKDLNPVIRGWRNYFRVGNSTAKFQALDWYVGYRLLRWAVKRHGGPKEQVRQIFKLWYPRSGVEKFYLSGICRK